ncbi:uncharacterized protein LOC128307076 [Anopheles moucheti]|uniref:uncharacterized protein LOC128307076 n=1 Tax=Anopheles moucheti TaxID=186751 RepID=UPI0022EFFCE8|nr:uncharacterized protein LOC128307076 [Anopheles moucheti]
MKKMLCGLIFAIVIIGCIDVAESRAVNISNTWTLPQEGFSVFYRYFRDKISWFEADAVCQFHHANLVTVDNGMQFDATRAFLKELDVTSAVWIGLMRPENSARFIWTSSKTLDPASGYWAETIPAMEQPLCAVVDPVRDFRWHAFRCGGPETAAFLCELPVPTWAVDCTITSIPSLTVQYMSDSGTVQLSRDCGESGTKHITCQGKQDRDSIIEQLQCSDEEDLASVLTIDKTNQLMLGANSVASASSTRRPQQQSILEHDILTVVSSNVEESNNKIEVNPNQIEDTVKNVINKFNLQDLMRSEHVAVHSEELDGVMHNTESQRKSAYIKKYSPLYVKKNHYTKKNSNRSDRNDSGDEEDEDDEPMLGDQPMQDETETQPIDIIQQAVKPTADGDYADPIGVGNGVKMVNEKCNKDGLCGNDYINVKSTEIVTTPDSRLRRGTDSDRDERTTVKSTEPVPITIMPDITETTTFTTTISTSSILSTVSPKTLLLTTRTTASSHILPTTPKKEVITGDHFIPPMLLVKARFISARPQTESPPTTPTTLLPTASSTNIPVESGVTDSPAPAPSTSEANPSGDHEKSDPLLVVESTLSEGVSDVLQDEVLSATSIAPNTTDVHQAEHVVFEQNHSEHSEHPETFATTTRPLQTAVTTPTHLALPYYNINPLQAAALVSAIQLTQYSDYITTTIAPEQDTTVHSSESPEVSTSVPITTIIEEVGYITNASETEANDSSKTSANLPTLTTEQNTSHNKHTIMSPNNTKIEISEETGLNSENSSLNQKPINANEHKTFEETHDIHAEEEHEEYDEQKHSELHNSFSNVENYQPYKPNRHRLLTKSEVQNNHGAYIKKILG